MKMFSTPRTPASPNKMANVGRNPHAASPASRKRPTRSQQTTATMITAELRWAKYRPRILVGTRSFIQEVHAGTLVWIRIQDTAVTRSMVVRAGAAEK